MGPSSWGHKESDATEQLCVQEHSEVWEGFLGERSESLWRLIVHQFQKIWLGGRQGVKH